MSTDIEQERFSDYELAQKLKQNATLASSLLKYQQAIDGFRNMLVFARNLFEKKICYKYLEEENKSIYFFEGEESAPFLEREGNRDRTNEVSIFLKNNIRRLVNKANLEYRTQKTFYESMLRKESADALEKSMDNSALVEQSSKISFIQHEYEWFLKYAESK